MVDFIRYTPKQWRLKEFIRSKDLNHIEEGIGLNNDMIEDLIENGTGLTEEIKDYVNESINKSSAFFRGTFNTKAALLVVPWQSLNDKGTYYVSNNDYAYIVRDETHNNESWRYIYVYEENGQNNGWQAQYKINESEYTFEEGNVDGAFAIRQDDNIQSIKIHGIRAFALGNDDEGEETEIIFDCGTAEDMLSDNS